MICTYKTHVLGIEQKTSQKTGNPYFTMSIMDGAKPISIMVKNGVNLAHVVPFKQMTVTVEIELGKYTKATIIDVKE